VVFDESSAFSKRSQLFPFLHSFQWDSFSNILVEMILFAPQSLLKCLPILLIISSSQSVSSDYTLFLKTRLYRFTQNLFSSLTNEVTLLLQYGNPKYQPQNNTVFEGVDSATDEYSCSSACGRRTCLLGCRNDGSGYDRMKSWRYLFIKVMEFLAFTKNTSTGEMKIYLNGVLFRVVHQKARVLKM
jgi:hypothetical protein